MPRLGARHVRVVEVTAKLVQYPWSRWAAARSGERLRRPVRRLLLWVLLDLEPGGDACLEQKQVGAAGGEVCNGRCGPREVVKKPVAVDDVEHFREALVGRVEVESLDPLAGKPPSQHLEVGVSTFRDRDRAAAVEEERRMVADPSPDLEDGSIRDREVERCQVLQPPLVVPQVMVGVELGARGDGSDTACRCLQPFSQCHRRTVATAGLQSMRDRPRVR